MKLSIIIIDFIISCSGNNPVNKIFTPTKLLFAFKNANHGYNFVSGFDR